MATSGERDRTGDWGVDYSLLLHNVEDRIDKVNQNHLDSSRKRSRLDHSFSSSSNSQSILDLSTLSTVGGGGGDLGDLTMNQNQLDNSLCLSVISHSSTIRLNLQIDELKLQVEELTDKSRREKEDYIREKEKFIRQLQFLETDNTRLKSELESRNEKYYALKKKLQTTIRAAELEKQTLTQQLAATSSNKSGNSSRVDSAPKLNQESNSTRDSILESLLLTKNSDIRNLTIKNTNLEDKCVQLEQQLLTLRAESSSKISSNLLQKNISELEGSLRKKTKEIDRLETQLKNQSILEQELASCQSMLQHYKQTVKNLSESETKYHQLMKEKDSWMIYFKDIIQELPSSSLPSSLSSFSNDSNETDKLTLFPVIVLRTLSHLQGQCISLLHSECDLEAKNSEITSLYSTLLSQFNEMKRDRESEKEREKELANQLLKKSEMWQRQSQLYEGEVKSLRTLLTTFDMEIGLLVTNRRQKLKSAEQGMQSELDEEREKEKEGYTQLIGLKERIITDLRKEVDDRREESKRYLTKVHEIETQFQDLQRQQSSRSESEKMSETHTEELKMWKEKCSELSQEIFDLQMISRVDYNPSTTKVLRLQRHLNPSYSRYITPPAQSDDMETINDDVKEKDKEYMTPIDEIKSLRKQIRQLKTELILLQDRPRIAESGESQLNTTINPSLKTTKEKISVVDSEKLNLRLKEMFRERINSYREAIYLLLGYKVDLISADAVVGGSQFPQLRLRSIYAENPDDSLLFQWKDGTDLELLETPFAANLDDSVLHTLRASNSIPVFLSNICLDLFEKQTFLG